MASAVTQPIPNRQPPTAIVALDVPTLHAARSVVAQLGEPADFYKVGVDYYVARHWGRNGAKGQQMVESFGSKYSALDAANKLYGEKLRKGYRPEASPLDKIVREV